MKQQLKRALALSLALAMLILSGCGPIEDPSETTTEEITFEINDGTTTGDPGDHTTTAGPDDGTTTAEPDDDGTTVTDPEDDGTTTTEPQDNVTTTEPQDDVTTTEPQDDVTTTRPQDDVTTTKPQDDVTTTKPQDDVTTTEPDDDTTTADPDLKQQNPVTNVPSIGAFNPICGIDAVNGAGSSMGLHVSATHIIPEHPGATLGADGKLYLSGWAMVDGGQHGMYWSLDRYNWHPFAGTYQTAGKDIMDATAAVSMSNPVAANGLFADITADLSAYEGQSLTVYVAVYGTNGAMIELLKLNHLVVPVTHTVTFKDENGTVLKTQTVIHGQSAEAPAVSKPGYTFDGWDVDFTNVTGDLTVTASFKVSTYTVVFENWDGTSLKTETLTHGATVTPPADPTRPADVQYTYTFAGWDTPVSPIATGNVTYKATYSTTLNKYTVSFKSWDGSAIKTETLDYGAAITVPDAPDREGYTFTGWSSTPTATVEGNAEYTAQYAIKTYQVIFRDHDGTQIGETQTVEHGSAATAPADPERTGYTFIGWSTEFASVKSDLVITATYQVDDSQITYTITWIVDGVTTTSTAIKGETPVYNAGATPEKAADAQYTYTFSGWNTEIVPASGNATYEAQFSKTTNKYVITWKVDGQDDVTAEVEYGTVPTYPNGTPKKASTAQYTYYFDKWDVEPVAVTGPATYTATFTFSVNKYAVTFYGKDGNQLGDTQQIEYGSAAVAPVPPTVDGYVFEKWNQTFDNVTDNLDVYAVYVLDDTPVQRPERDPYDAFTCSSCGYISCTDTHNPVKLTHYDAIQHQNANVSGYHGNYITAGGAVNGQTFAITENSDGSWGNLTVSGWIGVRHAGNYRLALRVGTNTEVNPYNTWSLVQTNNDADVINAAQSQGCETGIRFTYYIGTGSGSGNFQPGDKIHLFLEDLDTGLIYCFSEFVLTRPGKAACGNFSASENKSTVGTVRVDSFSTTGTTVTFDKVKKLAVATYNDRENQVFTISGWLPTNLTSNYELAFRVGHDNPVQYRNWSVTEGRAGDQAAVTAAAQGEGYAKGLGFTYNFGFGGLEDNDVIHLFLKDKTTGNVYCFCEITVHIKEVTVPAAQKYTLGYGSSHSISAYDPIPNKESVTAPNDDATVKLWFDHLSEKLGRYDTSDKDTGPSSYTIQMAKNEMEGCHFYLYAPTHRKVTLKISDFENAQGEKLETELGVEFYMEDGYINYQTDYPHYKTFQIGDKDASGEKTVDVYPDAVIPYESYIKEGYGDDEQGYYKDANGTWQRMEYGAFVNIGPFSYNMSDAYPLKDSIRGFTVQATTTKSTTPGAYKATVEVYDYETGKCIKMANVYTYVYDVTLSEQTELDTYIGIWGENYMQIYRNFGGYNEVEVIKAQAEFMLKYRMTPGYGTWTIENVLCADGDLSYLRNPRVTTLRIFTQDQYNKYKDDPVIASKLIYYGQDEPGVPRNQWRGVMLENGTSATYFDQFGIISMLGVAEEAKYLQSWGWEDYRLVIPFERNVQLGKDLSRYYDIMKASYIPNMSWAAVEASINSNSPAGMTLYNKYKTELQNSKDMVDFLSKYVTVWTYIPAGSTPRELMSSTVLEKDYMQDTQLDDDFGEYADRMSKYQAQGDELWMYVACEPKWDAPYQNILHFNDGTEARTMFWTAYRQGQTGFLYWREDYYNSQQASTYVMRNPFSQTGPGDGILFYPGAIYGQYDPIPSIRFINMRDGIEDYQMLCMLEQYKGVDYADQLASHIVTSPVTFTRDGDVVYNVHAYMLRQLEAAMQ